jgi:hypothetical protein
MAIRIADDTMTLDNRDCCAYGLVVPDMAEESARRGPGLAVLLRARRHSPA